MFGRNRQSLFPRFHHGHVEEAGTSGGRVPIARIGFGFGCPSHFNPLRGTVSVKTKWAEFLFQGGDTRHGISLAGFKGTLVFK